MIISETPDIQFPSTPKNEQEINEYMDKFKKIYKKYRDAASICTSLQFLTPVFGEAFINLIIFILAKPEIRKEKRWIENTMRQQIDIRLKTLHLNCLGFAKAIDGSKKEYKDFHTLMNRRNDILHGNIDPKKLSFEEIYFDQGNIPLFRKEISSNELILAYSLKKIEPKEVLKNVKVVKNFIKYILNNLNTKIKKDIEIVLKSPELGWRADKFRVGVILPNFTSEIMS
ncbi:MAG: hypothetical protein JXB26_13860 [Candidatus Aminicenantes bacterium]|nr:hypothetical protein [Candidatus Aminicenantes bacterium]